MSIKLKFDENLTRNNGHFTGHTCIFMITCRSVLLRMRNVSERVVEKIKTHSVLNKVFFFLSENGTVYEIMWKNVVEPGRSQMTKMLRRK